jgi:hypothetical protein
MTSVRSAVGIALRDRLKKITTANGYTSNIKKVFYDKIPLGLELESSDMPALFLLDDGATSQHLHGVIEIARAFRIQIVDDEESSDEVMNEHIRNVGKVVWADSPTAETQDQYRFHERVYQVEMDGDETDLHMIEGNRIASVQMIVHYRTRPYDL